MTKKSKRLLFIIGLLIVIGIAIFIMFKNKKNITYTVTFDTFGGTIIESQIIGKGGKVTRPEDPVKDGYIFVNWQYQNHIFDFDKIIDKNIILEAKWSEKSEEDITIKFDTDGGSFISSLIITKNSLVNKPTDPVKEGYKFVGWYLNNKEFNFDTKISENITLLAKWEKEETNNTKYTIIFDSDGGSAVKSQTVEAGKKVSKPKNPTKAGYEFVEWQLDGKKYNFNNTISSDLTLVAKWEKAKEKYTVTFDSNGGSSVNSQTIISGNKITKPANPTKIGYTFIGWTLNGSDYNFESLVTSNLTLVAKWQEITKNSYTVTFNSNGGTSINSQTVLEGEKISKPDNPTKAGYNFAGWTLNNTNYDFNSGVTSNITLVAKWNQKVYTVNVTKVDSQSPDRILSFYEDGVKISVNKVKYTDGQTLCSGSNPTVNVNDIEGESKLVLVLNSGIEVTANINN